MFAEGQAVMARYAGSEFRAVIDRYFPGSAYQQVRPLAGRWISPIVIHEDDLRLLPADHDQLVSARLALADIGRRAGFTPERVAAIVAGVFPDRALDSLSLVELATAQDAVRSEARRTTGLAPF